MKKCKAGKVAQKDTFHLIEDDKITVNVDDTALYLCVVLHIIRAVHHLSYFWCTLCGTACVFYLCMHVYMARNIRIGHLFFPIRTQCVSLTFLLLLIESHFEKWMWCKFARKHPHLHGQFVICMLSIAVHILVIQSIFFIAFYCV